MEVVIYREKKKNLGKKLTKMGYNAFYSVPVIYLWWLTLRLCCWPILMRIEENQTKDKINDEFVEGTDGNKEFE